jgi:hypothetical protein
MPSVVLEAHDDVIGVPHNDDLTLGMVLTPLIGLQVGTHSEDRCWPTEARSQLLAEYPLRLAQGLNQFRVPTPLAWRKAKRTGA